MYERHKSSLLQLEREQVRDQVWQKHPPTFHRHVQMLAMKVIFPPQAFTLKEGYR